MTVAEVKEGLEQFGLPTEGTREGLAKVLQNAVDKQRSKLLVYA